MNRRATITNGLLLATFIIVALIRLRVGGGDLSTPVLQLRAARLATGATVGAALAVAGVFLQALLRNPLASPDLLGLASGSGFAVMAAVKLGLVGAAGVAATGLGALSSTGAAVVGAVGALGLTYTLSQRRGLLDPVLLVLTGVVVSIVCSAGTMLIRHLLPFQESEVADRMLRGALREDVSAPEYIVVGGLTLVGIIVGVAVGRAMDATSLSEDEALSVGVPLAALRRTLFILSGLLTAGSVVLAGPIGFVGLICPHLVRLLAGPGHRALVLGSALAGATLVVLADIAIRVIELPTGRLPISVLTAIIGGPAFVVLLRRQVRGLT